MTNDALAMQFFEALGAADVGALRSLLAPDARFWVNIGPIDLSADQRLAVLELERTHLASFALHDLRFQTTGTGFVLQFTTDGTTTDGAELHIPACLVAEVDDDGRITRVDEYADSAPAKPLLRAISGGSR
jgi:ketosteroid isomerase-like protein